MIKYLLQRLSPKISSVLTILSANVFNSFVTFVVHILFASRFGPEIFGIFSLAVSVMMMVNIFSDIGLNLTLVRFFNLYKENPVKQNSVLSSLFVVRIAVFLFIIGVSFPLGYFLTRTLELESLHRSIFHVAIITGGLLTIWVYFQNYQQAHRNFVRLSYHIFGYGLLRILCVGVFLGVADQVLDDTSGFFSLYTLPVAAIILIGIVPIIRHILSPDAFKLRATLGVVGEAMKYGRWVAVSSITYALMLRVTQFVLAFRVSKYELGILSAGFVFTFAFSTLNMAVRAVYFPHVTALDKLKDMRAYLRQVRKNLFSFASVSAVMVILLSIIQIVFLSDKYRNALPVFLITSTGLAATIIMGLITMLLHTLMRPQIIAIVNILRLLSSCVLVFLLAPSLGAIGGAIAYVLPLVSGELYMAILVKRILDEK